ncbi:MAG: hypothetical protein H7246_14250 [Phycisphaerae bacterium]|nr:hypothetical protein [Saprospiraceae bacterium]
MKPLLPAFAILLLTTCSPAPKQPLVPAFFCWETTLDISASEREIMDSLGCKKLYIKTLDIGRIPATGEIEPYSITDISDTMALAGLEIIPTFFITNEVFQNIASEKMDWLASKIVATLTPFRGLGAGEVLFDCDWTPSTREAFFLFLKKMRGKLPSGTTISATIRLHQYKFPKQTGVPPVDRGMLMFYNTGDVDEESERNTVFHPDDALKYLNGASKNYPLPLDLALPLFSWGLIFREGELWKIVPGPLPLDEMRRSKKYVEQPATEPFSARLWELKEGTFLGGHYLRPGHHLRVSAISPELLFKAALLAQKLDLADDASVAFFHLGIAKSEHFSAQLLDSLCKSVRK